MGDSCQQGLQQGLQRLGGARTERQQRETASSSSNARPAALPRAPPRNIAPPLEQPAGTDYGSGGTASSRPSCQRSEGYDTGGSAYGSAHEPSGGGFRAERSSYGSGYQQYPPTQPAVYSNTPRGTFTDWRAVRQSIPPMKDTLPAVVQTLAPQSDPPPPPRSSTGGRSRARRLAISDILNPDGGGSVIRTSSQNRVPSPMPKAFPRQLAGNSSGGASEDNISQPQPRSSQTRIDIPPKGVIWSEEQTQVLGDVMYGHQRGDNHVCQRASERLGGARNPETCWKKWKELTAQKLGGEKVGKTYVRIAARPATQYTGEPTFSKQYDNLLTSGWDVIDANKLHVLKYLDRHIKAKTLVLELGRKYSETSIRDQLLNLRNTGLLTRKPASRPWTGADKALYKELRERGASEDKLMRACIRTKEDIQQTSEDWGVEDTVMSSKGHGMRQVDERKEVDNESKRRRPG